MVNGRNRMAKIVDNISFVRGIVRSALWSVQYNSKQLPKAYADLAFAKELLKRGGFDLEGCELKRDSDGEEIATTVEEFALRIINEKKESVEHYEDALSLSHHKVSL